MNVKQENNARRPRKWRESFTVWIDFIGDRSQIGPLLDHIAGCNSDGGGQFVALPLSDQSWTFTASGSGYSVPVTVKVAGDRALAVFDRLKAACRARWSPYIRLRLLHDDNPDRCSPVEVISETTRAGHRVVRLKHAENARGPLVLRKYQRGKCPDLSKIVRPRRRAKRTGASR